MRNKQHFKNTITARHDYVVKITLRYNCQTMVKLDTITHSNKSVLVKQY